jgi:hypothetical protein
MAICVKLNSNGTRVKRREDDSAIPKTKAVVQHVAVSAPIWSHCEHESQV